MGLNCLHAHNIKTSSKNESLPQPRLTLISGLSLVSSPNCCKDRKTSQPSSKAPADARFQQSGHSQAQAHGRNPKQLKADVLRPESCAGRNAIE